jgi:hypothetical protein
VAAAGAGSVASLVAPRLAQPVDMTMIMAPASTPLKHFLPDAGTAWVIVTTVAPLLNLNTRMETTNFIDAGSAESMLSPWFSSGHH